jgi:hypothetical protein
MTIPQPQDQLPNQPPPHAEPGNPVGYYSAPPPVDGPRPKSPALACILSVVPGLGQIYVGYYGLGFLHSIVAAAVFSILLSGPTLEIFPMLVIFLIFFMLYNIVDAGRRASLYNLAIAGVPGVDLPQPLRVPRFGGSIFGGSVLIVAGFALLMHTKFQFSLDWIEEWWPVAPMIFGAYLIYRAIQDRAATVE